MLQIDKSVDYGLSTNVDMFSALTETNPSLSGDFD